MMAMLDSIIQYKPDICGYFEDMTMAAQLNYLGDNIDLIVSQQVTELRLSIVFGLNNMVLTMSHSTSQSRNVIKATVSFQHLIATKNTSKEKMTGR